MGEILAYAGRAEEAEQWVEKSMKLNPYHPPRYWTHLARAYFHQGRYEDAREALEHVGKARMDDLAYRVAASVALDDKDAVAVNVAQLLDEIPDFTPTRFIESQPYVQESDRQALLELLTASFRGASAR